MDLSTHHAAVGLRVVELYVQQRSVDEAKTSRQAPWSSPVPVDRG